MAFSYMLFRPCSLDRYVPHPAKIFLEPSLWERTQAIPESMTRLMEPPSSPIPSDIIQLSVEVKNSMLTYKAERR